MQKLIDLDELRGRAGHSLTQQQCDWSSDVCSSDLTKALLQEAESQGKQLLQTLSSM